MGWNRPSTEDWKDVLRVAAFVLGTVLSPLTRQASAQEVCVIRNTALQHLDQQYGERPVGRGRARAGKTMVELLTSDGGTWTIVVTNVRGRKCVLASGEAWTDAKAQPGEPS